MKGRGLTAAVVHAALCGVLTLTAQCLPASALAAGGKTLVFCSEASPAGFDPAQYTTSVEFTAAAYTVYNRLVEFERGGTRVEPALAEKWEISPDGLQYTFHLRHGVKFQTTPFFKPTRELNADDVVFSFERMRDPNQPFAKAYPVQYPYYTDMGLDKNLARVEKIDPYTVRFTLKQVDAPFLQDLAMPLGSILSAEYAQQLLKEGHPADMNQKPLGTGPFAFRSYQKDAVIRFDANPSYWKPQDVKLDKLIFSITVDPAVRLQKLRRNECQVMTYPRLTDIPAIKADKQLQLLSQTGFNLGYVSYNTTHKPFDKLDVRRALDMSINKPAIVQSVYQGAAQVATNPMPPSQWGYDKSLKDAPYDPAKAKEMLKAAGYPNGFETTLWAMPVSRPYNPNARLMAEMIQADWARIGVKVRIVTYEWGEYLRRIRNFEHDTLLMGWTGDNGDPDNWLGTVLSCSNMKWCDKHYDDLVERARHTTDQAERVRLYGEAQRIFKQQVPFTPIAHSMVYQPLAKNVEGFTIDPFGSTQFRGVSLK